VLNFTKKMILIGGTGYTGEIKKGIFTVLNYVLPARAQGAEHALQRQHRHGWRYGGVLRTERYRQDHA
jgi:ATP-dependent phosphoenolpyruvate carboxykinase